MRSLKHLFDANRAWSQAIRQQDPEFSASSRASSPPSTSGSGAPTAACRRTRSSGCCPGEIFVHRNIANLVVHTDLNCLSVMQFAVDVLKVRHIIVCGHYGCSGVQAALARDASGLIDNWLRHVQDVRLKHEAALDAARRPTRAERLCELNVIEQVANVCQTSIARDAWERGQELAVHGWVYGIDDGLLKDLDVTVTRFRRGGRGLQGGGAPSLALAEEGRVRRGVSPTHLAIAPGVVNQTRFSFTMCCSARRRCRRR